MDGFELPVHLGFEILLPDYLCPFSQYAMRLNLQVNFNTAGVSGGGINLYASANITTSTVGIVVSD